MKKIFAITIVGLLTSVMLNAQSWLPGSSDYTSAGSRCVVGEANYEQLFLDGDDALKSSWGLSYSLGMDYFVMDNIYAGASLGFSQRYIKYDFGAYGKSDSSVYDIQIPIRAGVSFLDSNLRLETGPFANFTIGGSTTTTMGRETTTTKIKDMEVSRAALGWSINIKVFRILNIGYSFMLTDSPYGDGGEFGFLTIGLII